MRVEINLLFEIWLVVLSDIVIDQGDGHNQRNIAFPIMINDL
jgi:hypothetical protein